MRCNRPRTVIDKTNHNIGRSHNYTKQAANERTVYMTQNFYFGKDILAKEVGQGVTRQMLAHDEQVMMVKIAFEKDAVGAAHTHPHTQVTYIVSGRFRFTNEGETHEVSSGDSLYFAPNVSHGTLCLEAGELIDVFTPCRKDFL